VFISTVDELRPFGEQDERKHERYAKIKADERSVIFLLLSTKLTPYAFLFMFW
jgi:hypothetical protein